MKKIFVTLSLILSSCVFLIAQQTTETFAKKDNVLGVGFGIGGVYGFSSVSSQSPVFGVQYDRGIIELKMGGVIGVGGFLGYKTISYKYNGPGNNYKDKWNIIVIGARGTFHYDLFEVENLDTYGGAMIAFHVVNEIDGSEYSKNHGSAAYPSLFAGAKYYFAPQVAAFAEVGYGVSWLTGGIAFKF